MRIALVTREYPPDTAWGGIGTFYGHFARALAAAGCSVEVFCQSIASARLEAGDGVRVHHVLVRRDGTDLPTAGSMAGHDSFGAFSYALAASMLEAVSRRHAEAPFDIVEGHEHLGINAFINMVGLEGAATVTRYHTAYHSLVCRGLVGWPPSETVRLLEKQSIHAAKARIASSAFIEQVARKDFEAPRAEAVIHNFAGRAAFAAGARRDGARENLIAFVGRLVLAHKRPDLAVGAFVRLAREFPDWRLEIAGPDAESADGTSAWDVCRAQIPPDLAQRVRYRGAVPRQEVDAILRRARLLVVPSAFESFGMVAIEAMQQGCLPIVADNTALESIVADPALRFANGDIASLVETCRPLMRSPALLEAKRDQCQATVARLFDPERLLAQNLDVFEALVERPAEPRHAGGAPLISVIVPSYNQGRFIGETLRSILEQDYPNKEVIVVDGGSTDSTLGVLRSFPGIRWISEPDRGQAHAIHKGLLLARGEILAYLNSDDVYRPGALSTVAEVFAHEPETMILTGDCDYIDADSRTVGFIKARYPGIAGLLRYWGWDKWQAIPQQSTFWRRSLVAKVGFFDSDLHFVMDLDYWLRAARQHPIRVVDRTLAAFRLASGSKTIDRTDEIYLEEYATFRRHRSVLAGRDRWSASIAARRHCAGLLLNYAEHLVLGAGLRRRPAKLLLRAMGLWPLNLVRPRFWLAAANCLLTGLAPKPRLDHWHRRALRVLARGK